MSISPSSALVFVAGATGYTGRSVVQACRAAGLRTMAHVRPDSRDLGKWRERFEALGAEVDTTPWELPAFVARFAELKPEVVFGLLGTTTSRARREGLTDRYLRIDYGLTAMLIDAATPLPRPRFVYLSAVGVAPNRGAYIEARYRAEQKLYASGLPYVVARPGLITGDREESRPMENLFAALCRPAARVARLAGSAHFAAWLTPMTGDELARAIVKEALQPRSEAVVLEPADLQALAGKA